ncbi:DUF397 domain-containing protein [Streptomyces sp. Je 1-4]|uniref:DUF397 domain-containing protein n=1 Tax=Streptomyces lydicus TaxID=47763 RepID=A0A3S9YKC7_9ACTN|nr:MULTISPECIES: DUF397 domain-containing protein [Streptomyces]AZS75365.1 DUF397 domain-containing protein [Streptomyces lydicus]QIK05477.1 DUF397 domain-containing protein [Streptomyces sp. ID38640]UYB38699.1 DUF397 domain-containing protein [Streptomyces sp. Je 1-4]UZQ34675.1 DUF397 domain-containing protein [Streptomyces sp. Je 1-4] [Streptomyces sp. Je 1-4 4N24]UZQ42093.1 DUF397 domain-containing protein [Streptomyces sp. Je 1-4] [Streptomyces sp. Je 1-4 4N24_ara]
MPEFRFRKSSYSNAERECLEVATNIPGTVAIRDSKNPAGPILQLGPDTWTTFRSAVVTGRFER